MGFGRLAIATLVAQAAIKRRVLPSGEVSLDAERNARRGSEQWRWRASRRGSWIQGRRRGRHRHVEHTGSSNAAISAARLSHLLAPDIPLGCLRGDVDAASRLQMALGMASTHA